MNDLSEKEQIQELRAWWQENGRYVIAGVLLGVTAIFSWNYWRSSVEATQIEASNLFEEVMEAVGGGNADAAEAAAGRLYAGYGQTVYPNQARLAMARLYMDKGRDQEAADTLRDLVASGDDSEIGMVGRLRLAKILLYQEKPDEVVALLSDHVEGGFTARYNELLGDAYAAQGNYAEAAAAYRAAMADGRNLRTIDNNLIRLKLNDLPDAEELASSASGAAAAVDDDIDASDAADESPAELQEAPPGDDAGTEPESQ